GGGSGGAGAGGGASQQQQPSSPPGVPMYAVHGEGYSTLPIQQAYALNGDAYAQGVVSHLPPQHAHAAHGLTQMQAGQGGGGGGIDGPISGVGDQQQLLGPHMSGMRSPPHPPLPAPQQMYVSAQGAYVVAAGNSGGSNGVSSAGGGVGMAASGG
ncbi:unnamed protein product, partial [Laminaria digitata]